jgi:NAD(P)-dependent dehydrogenase (short-subunit alcohol dehydrogenase family)
MAGRTVLVIGPSDSIGAETARFLVGRGTTVHVTGRSADKLRPVDEAVCGQRRWSTTEAGDGSRWLRQSDASQPKGHGRRSCQRLSSSQSSRKRFRISILFSNTLATWMNWCTPVPDGTVARLRATHGGPR